MSPAQRTYREIADRLRSFIRECRLSYGARLPGEVRLAEIVGVSRPTLRAAMLVLELSGEIEVCVGAGAFVRSACPPLSIRIADTPGPMEVLRTRMTVEPPIAAEAAVVSTSADVGVLERLLCQLEHADSLEWHAAIDRAFHHALGCSANQHVSADLIAGLMQNRVSTGAFDGALPHSKTLAHYHRCVAAIRDRDAHAASHAMAAYLRDLKEAVTSARDLPEHPSHRLAITTRRKETLPGALYVPQAHHPHSGLESRRRRRERSCTAA